MRRQAILLCLAIAGGGATGWFTADHPRITASEVAAVGTEAKHAGLEAGDARRRLVEAGIGVGAATEEALETPPPVDVAVLFRRDLTAIEHRPEGALVWIVDFSAEYRRRSLRVGDLYQDGWRVSNISVQFIELRRRREVRRVAAFEAPPPEQ